MSFIVFRLITFIFLLGALIELPYGYYTLLRFLVCGVSGYTAYIALELNKKSWVWIFGIIALLFNPLIPIYLDKGTWQIIDIITAIFFIISLFSIKKPNNKI